MIKIGIVGIGHLFDEHAAINDILADLQMP
jgi:hypothetical protein